MFKTRFGMALCSVVCLVAAQTVHGQNATPPDGIKVERFVVGGVGGWDLLAFQPERQRLFISRADRVLVFDARAGKVVKEIPGTPGIHGIALAKELGLGFTSNGQSNSVTVFDLESLNVVAEIKGTGEKPDAILYDPASRQVFAFNGRSHDVTVIDPMARKIVATIALPGKPELAVINGKGQVFVNLEDRNSIARIDIAKSTVTAVWPLTGCDGPTGLAIDVKNGRLFSVCDNQKMLVMDAGSGNIVGEAPIGDGPDGVVFDAGRGLVVSSNGGGNLSVIRQDGPDRYSPLLTIPTRKGARTSVLDETEHEVYLVTSDFGPAPAATPEQPHPRPSQILGTFTVLRVAIGAVR